MSELSDDLSFDVSSKDKYEDTANISDTKSSTNTFYVSFSQGETLNESKDNLVYIPEFGIIHIDEVPPNPAEQKAIEDLEIKLNKDDYSGIVSLE